MADPHRMCLYAIDRGNDNILFIDPVSQSVLKTIYVGKDPTGFDIDATGKRLYVANKGPGTGTSGSYRIAVVDLDTREVISSYVLPQLAVNVTAGRDGRLYYNSGYDLWNSGDAHVLNTATGADLGSFAGVKSRMVISSDKTRLYGQYIYYGNLGQMGVWNASSDQLLQVDALAYSPYPYGWDYDNYCLSGNDRYLAYGCVLFSATNLVDQIGLFSEQVYALNHDGSIAFGASAVWDSTTFKTHGNATKIADLPFSTTVMAFDDGTDTLYAFDSANNELNMIKLMTVVTFNAQGGTVNPNSKPVTYGEVYGALPIPARTGYTFTSWLATTNGVAFEVTSNSVVAVSENHSLVASWTVNRYTVSFDAQGGAVDPTNQCVTYMAAYGALPTPTRTGYTFTGWVTSIGRDTVSVNSNSVVSISGDHTLIATWTGNSYILTFDARGGTVNPTSKTVTFGLAYGVLPTPTRIGYVFEGWGMSLTGTVSQVTESAKVIVAANQTLYAYYGPGNSVLCPPDGTAALSSAGTYDGFIYCTEAFADTVATSVRGTLTLYITTLSGVLTAKADIQTGSLNFISQRWPTTDANGTCHASLAARGGETLDLYFSQDRVWGTLTGGKVGVDVLEVDGARNRFTDRKASGAQTLLDTYRGYYTVALPAANALSLGSAQAAPDGSGYLTLTIGNGGSAKIAGVLADGTPVSQSNKLILFDGCGPEACVPFFVPLYLRKGWTGGLLWLDPISHKVITDRNQSWFIRWEKPGAGPDGFIELLDACGGFYNTIPSLEAHYLFSVESNPVRYPYTGGTAECQAAALPHLITVTASGASLTMRRRPLPRLLNGAYDYSMENSSMAMLAFTASTGIFKGKFLLYYDYTLKGRLQHKTAMALYAGVLTPVRSDDFAGQPSGQGYYLVPDNDPALKVYRLKRSYQVTLEAAE